MKPCDTQHGFRLVKRTTIPEAGSEATEFSHEASGARLVYLKNTDDNKVFSIAFRTPPTDDTGAAHIVEHSVLCGSRRFPLKEPFVELAKGSLNTFLNAMTYPDKTVYPVASRNAKDFRNLMDVYLDAVFHPLIYEKKETLLQEGWHYELAAEGDPLSYSGVVYSEMKGAVSSPEDLLETAILKGLYPDTAYSFESGGNPEKIPTLTQEMFTSFHRRYYHPSNSYIWLYGDMDIDDTLAFLDEKYLSKFGVSEPDSEIRLQEPFGEMKRISAEYPIGADEDETGKTYLAFAAVTGDAKSRLDKVAVSVLAHALFMTDAAPVQQAILASGIGRDVTASMETQVAQPYIAIEVTNAEPEDTQAFYDVLMNTLRHFAQGGLDRSLVEASLNFIEFKTREADFQSTPKGLVYNLASLSEWIYGLDPTGALFYEEDFKTLREGLTTGFFEDVIRRLFVENPHAVLITMKPSRTMAAKREEKTREILAAKKAAMSEEEIRDTIKTAADLASSQEAADPPEMLEKIPLLALSDIKREMDPLVMERREISGREVIFSSVPTNGIAYVSLYFDAEHLTPAEQLVAYLVTDLLGALGTDRHTYGELSNLINLHTGGIDYDVNAYDTVSGGWTPKTVVKARVFVREMDALASLLTEILTGTDFSDRVRLAELLGQSLAGAERHILTMPHRVMASRLGSYLSPARKFDDVGILDYYFFLRELCSSLDARRESLVGDLTNLSRKMFARDRLMVSLTADAGDYGAAAASLARFIDSLPAGSYSRAPYPAYPFPRNEGLVSASRVQYVGKGANYRRLGYEFTGSMRVLETIMRYGYLWTRLRVQGGAYGASAQFSREGAMLFTSYRDPHLTSTLRVYDEAADYIRGFTASPREMTKYIIGTISAMDTPLTPQMKGGLAAASYIRGLTDELRQKTREEVLATDIAKIRSLGDMVDASMRENIICVFGGEEKMSEHSSLFKKLIRVME